MTHRVNILVFEGVEVLDFAGPYEVFTTASRVDSRSHPHKPPLFATQCIARSADFICARAGLRVIADSTFATCPSTDVLIVPGGVVDAPMACPETIAWIATTAATARTIASVCTGAFLLARSGVLTHGPVTTHWEDVVDLHRHQSPLRNLRQWRHVRDSAAYAGPQRGLHGPPRGPRA